MEARRIIGIEADLAEETEESVEDPEPEAAAGNDNNDNLRSRQRYNGLSLCKLNTKSYLNSIQTDNSFNVQHMYCCRKTEQLLKLIN